VGPLAVAADWHQAPRTLDLLNAISRQPIHRST
jgi:hypothetical protein